MNRNFKMGDEVLVRVQIKSKDDARYWGQESLPAFSEEDIFARAPEYNIGEALEFKWDDYETIDTLCGYDWSDTKAAFYGRDGGWYTEARRPQPKPNAEYEGIAVIPEFVTVGGVKYKRVEE